MAGVQLFHTCLVNEMFPDVGLAAVRVLEHLGFAVRVPLAQTCCGQPAYNAGFHDEARVAAHHTIEVLDATTGPIVIPSGSCADMLVHQYAPLLEQDDAWRARASRLADRCVEFSAFVSRHVDALQVRPVQTSVVYHPSCHLARGLGVDREPRALIEAATGRPCAPLAADEECCGFGGLFSIKHAEISSRMLERKMANIAASGAERLVSCDMGCLLHLGGGLHRRGASVRVQHIAALLDESLP